MRRRMTTGSGFALLLGALALGACESGDGGVTAPEGATLFEVRVQDETFRIAAEDPEAVAALEARMEAGTEGVISGALAEGDGGFNRPWSWHMVPGSIDVPDVSIELCDGRPSMVEEDLDYWLNTVQRFCPWGAEVTRRLD